MRRIIGLALLLSLVLTQLGSGDSPKDKAPAAPTIEKLIEQLADQDFRKRDAADKAIRALGAEGLPALRKAINHPDPEVRRHLTDIIPILETASALAPKLVTLKVERKSTNEVIEELKKQTGYKFQFWGGAPQDHVYSFDFDKVPFWTVMDKISNECGLILQQGYGDDTLRFSQQDAYVPHIYHNGPFRMVANNFSYYRNINFSSVPKNAAPPQSSESLSFNFTICVEPKLPLLGIGQAVVTKAYDENKNSMMIPVNGNDPNQVNQVMYRHGGGYLMYCQQTSVNLVRTVEKARMVKRIEGSIPITLLLEQKKEVLSDKILSAKGKKYKIGATSFAIEDVTEQAGPQYHIKLSITNDNASPNDYSWQNSIYQRMELTDAKGNKFQNNGNSWNNSGPGFMQITMMYSPPGGVKGDPPAKLSFTDWKTMLHQVPFEFDDLPLP